MKSNNVSSVEELQVVGRFEDLRKILLTSQYADHRAKPLAYWALPSDRRLPLALLGRTLDDLLGTPFRQLTSTPGIGQKKLRSFVKLLARATNTDPSELPGDLDEALKKGDSSSSALGEANGFDPSTVSEVVWARWRKTVVERGLAGEALGRFAPSLKNMTRVIWNTPLEAYTQVTLTEMRTMKTHGEKRIRAILDVFHSVHALVAEMGRQEHLVIRIVPRRIDRVEAWIGQALQTPGVPSAEEILKKFIAPLLAQIRVDATRQIAELAEHRLGVGGPAASVRQAARTMGLTRARVYQLLNEINDITSVRWPMGRHQVYELHRKLQAELARMDRPPELTQFDAAIELFYPSNRRGAAGPLERSLASAEPNAV